MNKFFAVLGIIFLCLILVAVIGFSIMSVIGGRLDKESRAYVDQLVPVITQSWDSGELISRASPEFLKVASQEKLESFLKICAGKLGNFKKYNGAKGEATIQVTPAGKVVVANYIAQVDFERAPADVKITLIKRDKEWKILGFHINSDAFFE